MTSTACSYQSPPLCSITSPGSVGCSNSGFAAGPFRSGRRSTITRRFRLHPCNCNSASTPSHRCPASRQPAFSPCRANFSISLATPLVCFNLKTYSNPRASAPAIISSLPCAMSPRNSVGQSFFSLASSQPHNVGCAYVLGIWLPACTSTFNTSFAALKSIA